MRVRVSYSTTPACTALEWLSPEQTAGKEQPFLFSQCEAIHCRYCEYVTLYLHLMLLMIFHLHLQDHGALPGHPLSEGNLQRCHHGPLRPDSAHVGYQVHTSCVIVLHHNFTCIIRDGEPKDGGQGLSVSNWSQKIPIQVQYNKEK